MRRFPCPCCGHLVFGEPPGSYDVCPICYWEDDALQLEYATTLSGGAHRPTLQEAQRNFVSLGAREAEFTTYARRPTAAEARDPEWRPIYPSRDRFEEWGNPMRNRPVDRDTNLYYWRSTFWRC